MVDRQGIIDHLRELEASLQDWEKYRGSVSHIIAENRLRKPSSYREGFEVLAEGA